MVRGDPSLLDRVVANLLSNALKYAPAPTPVDVAVRREGGRVHLAVRDAGIGLEPEELAGLGRRYGRARGVAERGIPGEGLGLYLARAAVEAHGGRLWAESAGRDRGATLHVLLPARAAPPAGAPAG